MGFVPQKNPAAEGGVGACRFCRQQQLARWVDIARRGSEREKEALSDHHDELLAEGVMLASLKRLFSWSWRHGRRKRRLELGYCQKSSLVLEIPATIEYIDFEGSPDRLQITGNGALLTSLGTSAGLGLA